MDNTNKSESIPLSTINTFDNNIMNNNNSFYGFTWAAGLEMEATYVLNPLSKDDDWKSGLKQFYLLDFKKIIEHIDKKYNSSENKYPYLYEAEQSGRTCGPKGNKKYIIKPDPPSSMLEIATDTPYKDKNNPMSKEDTSSIVNYPL